MRRFLVSQAFGRAASFASLLALSGTAVVLADTKVALADRKKTPPVLHEPIPADPQDDLALSITLPGNIAAAVQTPRGLIAAPDPTRPIGSSDSSTYGASRAATAPGDRFVPDRDTKRPESLPYDEPFSPSTAPFKRLAAFDHVNADYTLVVARPLPVVIPIEPAFTEKASDSRFYADLVVDLSAGDRVRIPSVGAGAHVLHARAGVGARDIAFSLSKDSAENWFIEAASTGRARLVMELSAPRTSFGGDYGNPQRSALRPVLALPRNVALVAEEVSAQLGLSRRSSPREIVTKLVAHFRAFRESDEPPANHRDIYRDLALGQRGVCRHRAFAFLVTALHLGIPTRMVTNEAHAWVEVDDGRAWRRIDLGGAGRTLQDPLAASVPYEPPPDPFPWPARSTRGEDLVAPSRLANASRAAGANGAAGAPAPASAASAASENVDARDPRPPSTVSLKLRGTEARRRMPLPFSGAVSADGAPCSFLTVEVFLRKPTGESLSIGTLPTTEGGTFEGAFVLPPAVPLGDYEVHARTLGDKRCGPGETR